MEMTSGSFLRRDGDTVGGMAAGKSAFPENLWGYGKRLNFITEVLCGLVGTKQPDEVCVLDVGCGNGSQLAIPLAKWGFSITGIDIDTRSIEQAREISGDSANLLFRVASVEDVTSELFDAVILSEVLEHLKDPISLLQSSVERLKENGIVIVTVPNGYGEFEIDSWIFRKLRLQSIVDMVLKESPRSQASTENLECGHVQFFTRRAIDRLFQRCSLEVLREGVGSFLSGPIIGHTLARSARFIRWNARVADKLPSVMASSWYFALRRRSF